MALIRALACRRFALTKNQAERGNREEHRVARLPYVVTSEWPVIHPESAIPLVAIVSVDLPPRFTDAGENVQVAPGGRSRHPKTTSP